MRGVGGAGPPHEASCLALLQTHLLGQHILLSQGGVCVGLVVRDHLMKLLVEAVKRGTCQHLEVPFRWVL